MEYEVTALKIQKRNPNRVNVYLDGEFAFGLARIVAAWLQVGQKLTDQQVESLQEKDVDEKAYQSALRLLNYRPRSESELKKKLSEKGFSEAVIEGILERLRRSGLADDAQFAHAWVDNQSTFRPRGRRALALELRQKGISPEIIQETLDEAVDEESLAYQAAQPAARRLSGLEWQAFRVKLGQFLARRGFSYGTIAPVVSRVWAEIQSSQESPEAGEANDTDDEE